MKREEDSVARPIDVATNRNSRKWTNAELMGRVLWAAARPLFSLSPRLAWGWRRWLLRLFGAKIGRDVHVYPSVRIFAPWTLTIGDFASVGDGAILYGVGPIVISRRATISQYAHICAGTHDWRAADMPLVKASVSIGEDCWICADAFVGPGVTVGNGAIVGARAVAVKDLPADGIYVGNPARFVRRRSSGVAGSDDRRT